MNKNVSFGLLGVAAVLILFGLLNHFALHVNPVQHTSSIIGGLAAVCAIVGLFGMLSSAGKTA